MPDTIPTRWVADRAKPAPTLSPLGFPRPGLWRALTRGIRARCPACGQARLFAGWLRIVDRCAACQAPLGRIRADDAPPYFTIFAVGHVLVLALVLMEGWFALSAWLEAAILLPLALILALGLLRPIKGATVGLMMQLGLIPDESPPKP